MVNVNVVISATPIVAVRPGNAPITMPRNVAHKTLKIVHGVMKPRKATPNWPRLSNMRDPERASGQPNEKDALEHKNDQSARDDALQGRRRHSSQAHLALKPGLPFKQHDKYRDEDRRREPERDAPNQNNREEQAKPGGKQQTSVAVAFALLGGVLGRQEGAAVDRPRAEPDAQDRDDDAVKSRYETWRGVDFSLLLAECRHLEGENQDRQAEEEKHDRDPEIGSRRQRLLMGQQRQRWIRHQSRPSTDAEACDPARRDAAYIIAGAGCRACRETPWPCRHRSR